MVKKKACVFISGTGTNLKAIINSSRSYNFPINVSLVISNNKNAKGLILAKKFSIPFKVFSPKEYFFEKKILKEIKDKKISLICLAGYMKILSKNFIKNFKGKIVNIHPSLLPKYKGIDTFKRMLKNKEINAGSTVHYVNEKLDSGKVILKKSISIEKTDNEITLKKKVQSIEYLIFSEAIRKIYLKN